MSLTPSHQSGRPVPSRKQPLAPISTRHNPFAVLTRQLFRCYRNRLDIGTGIYYNIHDQRPDNHLNDDTPPTVINFEAARPDNVLYVAAFEELDRQQRMSARNTGSHPTALRSVGRGRLGRRDRMARVSMPTWRRLTNRLQGNLPARITTSRWTVLSDRHDTRRLVRSISEHQSRSESLRRVGETALGSIDNEPS